MKTHFAFTTTLLGICLLLLGSCASQPGGKNGDNRSQDNPKGQDGDLVAYKDTEVTEFFRRKAGWTAGDGTNTVPLSDGRVLWLMDDSHMGSNPDGTVDCHFKVNNAGLLQPKGDWDWRNTETLTGPDTTSLIRGNPDPGHFNWIFTGVQLSDTVYVFAWNLKYSSGGKDSTVMTERDNLTWRALASWGIERAGPPYWAKIKHPEMEVVGYHEHQNFGNIDFGNGFVKESDGYVYVYGHRPKSVSADVFVARFPQSDATALWTFWDGSDWVDDVSLSAAIGESASPLPFVSKVRDKYLLFSTELSEGCNQGSRIYVSVADSPTGPFSERKVIYEIDDRYHGNIPRVYWSMAHPEYINENDELLVTYNINNTSGEPQLPGCAPFCRDGGMNPDEYRPKGVRIPLELIDPDF